ncbi:MAG: hypothetical protein QXM27_00885 [Candidatus Pacearchaeota archaeon]
MEKRFILLLFLFLSLSVFLLYGCKEKMEVDKFYCKDDSDCACGIDKETGECAFGNKEYIDTSKQCPDFCTGIGGNLGVKCINNSCKIVSVK